jgi:NTP pyrophosphatase (non-canonical NTP hydrolase)
MDQNLQELLNRLIRFRDERDWAQFHTAKNLAISISLEAAELLEHFQWTIDDQDLSQEKIDSLSEEIADILIYILLLSHNLGIDLIEAAHRKIKKNEEKYPAELVRGRSEKYTEY